MRTINLQDLSTFCTLSFGKCAALIEATSVCLESQKHQSGVLLQVEGTYNTQFYIHWKNVNLKVRQSWQNLSESVEEAG